MQKANSGKISLPVNKKIIVYVGRLSKEKELMYFYRHVKS